MGRVILLVCTTALVAGCGATTSQRERHRPRTFSVGRIERAFAAQGVHLRVQRASNSSQYVLLGAKVPLRLVVWRSVRAANLAVTQLVTSANPRPARDHPDAILVRLGAPHWGNDVRSALFANVSFDFYVRYPGLRTRVQHALRRLHAPAGVMG